MSSRGFRDFLTKASSWAACGAALTCGMPVGCNSRNVQESPIDEIEIAVTSDGAVAEQAEKFCGACHHPPDPQSFTRQRWPHEVQRGFDFFLASGRTDLAMPKVAAIKQYYSSLAPTEFTLPSPLPIDVQATKRFDHLSLACELPVDPPVAGAALQVIDWGPPLGQQLMLSDMRNGGLLAASILDSAEQQQAYLGAFHQVAQLKNPCRFVQCDLEATGTAGLVVADLGSFSPADHNHGAVVWLRRSDPQELEFEKVTLLENVGRVADVQVADLDSDGDLDLVVSIYGWHETGSLVWLENRNQDQQLTADDFVSHLIDARSGTLETRIVDFDGDGKLDIVSLVAQQYEELLVRLGDGTGGFPSTVVLHAALDPAYGSSGFELVDFDQDGDLDVLFTNGDTFDSFQVKPYHAVHWLENIGDNQFKDRVLAQLPGVHRAIAVDIDGDGDLDVCAAAFMPDSLKSDFVDGQEPMALIWIENQGTDSFRIRPLQVGTCRYPALVAFDFNHDGRPDLAAANFHLDKQGSWPVADVWLSR